MRFTRSSNKILPRYAGLCEGATESVPARVRAERACALTRPKSRLIHIEICTVIIPDILTLLILAGRSAAGISRLLQKIALVWNARASGKVIFARALVSFYLFFSENSPFPFIFRELQKKIDEAL